MDDLEKRVLRKHQPRLQESVDVTDDILHSLRRTGVMDEQGIKSTMSVTEDSRMSMLIDQLIICNQPQVFEALCSALTFKHPWIAKDLQSDLGFERGSLKLDPDVQREASMLVHRKFGTSRRLGETDKKDMAEMIGIKIQLSKEEWRHELDSIREQLNIVTCELSKKDKDANKVADKLNAFIHEHQTALASEAHGMVSTSQTLMTPSTGDDVIGQLDREVTYLTTRTLRILKERNLLKQDREKCAHLLGMRKNDSTPLHELIMKKYSDLPQKVKNLKEQLDDKDKNLKQFLKTTEDYKNAAKEKDEKIIYLERALAEKASTVAMLDQRLREMEMTKFKEARHPQAAGTPRITKEGSTASKGATPRIRGETSKETKHHNGHTTRKPSASKRT